MLEDLVGIICPTLSLYRWTDGYSERWDKLLQVLCFRCETRPSLDSSRSSGLLIDGFMGLQHAIEWSFKHRGQADVASQYLFTSLTCDQAFPRRRRPLDL